MSQLRKHAPHDLDPEDPWANDKLERRGVADYLTPVIASTEQPFVISLNSPYGTGKTYFIECWREDLKRQGFHSVYFNAWKTDFSQDALFAFISALKRQFKEVTDETIKKRISTQFSGLTKKASGLARSRVIPLVLKGLAQKALGEETVEELIEAVGTSEEDIASLVETLAEEGLRAQEVAEDSLAAFKDYLAKIVFEHTEAETERQKKKIIIFVDELDRCRPVYAVQVLECIKHLFSVDGLLFVLAVDDRQLQNAVASVYGPKIDGDEYLRKFIDWRYTLPRPSARAFARYLCERFQLSETGRFDGQGDFRALGALAEGFGIFAEGLGLSLRQQEQCFTQINLAVRSLGEQQVPYANVLGVLVVIRTVHAEEYYACCRGELDVDVLLNLLEPSVKGCDFGNFYGSWTKFKSIFHSWFLDEGSFTKIHAEFSRLADQHNKMQENGRVHEDANTVKSRLDYLGDVIGYFRSDRDRLNLLETSLARRVFGRIEGAAALSED